MPKKESYEDLAKRLNAIINILFETAHLGGKKTSGTKKIEILSRSGLRPIEISKILGMSLGSVYVQLTRIRKRKKSRKGQ